MPAFSKYTEKNFALIRNLDPSVHKIFKEFLLRIGDAGIYVKITAGKRTAKEQDALYAQGRSKPGQIVTNANDSNSYHTWGLAIDIVPLRRIGTLCFEASYNDHRSWEALAKIGTELGLEWGYKLWGYDKPHFHYSGGLSIQDIKNGMWFIEPVFHITTKSKVTYRVMDRLGLNDDLSTR